MNEEYGVDFIARCMAGEALKQASVPSYTLVAGNHISILSDEETKTETISASVDNALSDSSENPVQNKIVKGALDTKPTTVNSSGTNVTGQKIMQLTKLQYDAIQNKDNDTYYMVTGDEDGINDVPSVGQNDDGKILTAAYSNGEGTYAWQNPATPADMATETWVRQQLGNVNQVPYIGSSDDGKVLKATYYDGESYYSWETPQSFTQVQSDWNQSNSSAVDYIKNKPTIPEGLPSHTSANLNDVLSVDSNNHVVWRDSREVPSYGPAMNGRELKVVTTGQTTSLEWVVPSEVPTVGSGDDGKVLTADYTGGTGSYSWETPATPADMATQTWVGQQGFLTSADEVPAVGSTDDGKVLTASYSGGQGSYSWETPSGGSSNLQFYITEVPAQVQDGMYYRGRILLPTAIVNAIKTDTSIVGYKFYGILQQDMSLTGIINFLLGSLEGRKAGGQNAGWGLTVFNSVPWDSTTSMYALDMDSAGDGWPLNGVINLINIDGSLGFERSDFSAAENIGINFISQTEVIDDAGKVKVCWAFEPIYGTLPTSTP